MTFEDYGTQAAALDRDPQGPLWYPALGLAGEVGEVIEHIKKYFRDGKPIDKTLFCGEMGDVLWYWDGLLRRTSRECGFELTPGDVAQFNIAKLHDRAKYGKR